MQEDPHDRRREYQQEKDELCLIAQLCSLCTQSSCSHRPEQHQSSLRGKPEVRTGTLALPFSRGLPSPARPAASVHTVPLLQTYVISSMEGSGNPRKKILTYFRQKKGNCGSHCKPSQPTREISILVCLLPVLLYYMKQSYRRKFLRDFQSEKRTRHNIL